MRIGAVIIVFGMVMTEGSLDGQATGSRPIKCGWGAHPELLRARIAALPERPDRQVKYISPGGAFAIHYDTTGPHSPDTTSTQVDGTPDWVVEVVAALDSVRNLLLALGFDPALRDDDGIYDVYLKEYGGVYYGETHFETHVGGGRYITYLEMDNDFAQDEYYYTHGIDAARVTCAHEYFHAVQLAYGWREPDKFFYEVSSTWFEDIAFPDVNDWVFWFKGGGSNPFGKTPTQPMARTDGYSIAIFGHYLTYASQDMDIMQQAWERFKSSGAVAAIEQSVASYGSNLTTAWTDFVARLFLNGRAPDPELYFYADQDLLDAPEPGMAETLIDNLSLPFYYLCPGTVGIQALEVEDATNLYLKVRTAPTVYAAMAVLRTQDPNLHRVGGEKWYATRLAGDSEVVLVVGGERDSVVVDARVSDLQLAMNRLYPNPMLSGSSDRMTIEYIVAKDLVPGEHHMIIYDLLGREVYHRRLDSPEYGQILTLNLPVFQMKNWPSGVYFLRLTLGSAYSTSRTFTILK